VARNCAAAKSSLPANHDTFCRRVRYTILQRTSGNKDVCLPDTITTADSSRSVRTIHQPRSGLPIQVESESEVKSLDRIKTLGPEHRIVRVPRTRRGPYENDGESQLQIPLLRALYAQISAVTTRTATSIRSNAGSKKEAGQEEISRKTAT